MTCSLRVTTATAQRGVPDARIKVPIAQTETRLLRLPDVSHANSAVSETPPGRERTAPPSFTGRGTQLRAVKPSPAAARCLAHSLLARRRTEIDVIRAGVPGRLPTSAGWRSAPRFAGRALQRLRPRRVGAGGDGFTDLCEGPLLLAVERVGHQVSCRGHAAWRGFRELLAPLRRELGQVAALVGRAGDAPPSRTPLGGAGKLSTFVTLLG